MAIKHRKYMEDDFDLELFIKAQNDKTIIHKIHEQSRKLSGLVKVLIIIASFITAYALYSYASYLIEVWHDNRINDTARDITRQAVSQQAEAIKKYPASEKRKSVPTPGALVRQRIILTPAAVLKPAILALRDEFQNNDIAAYLKIDGSNIDFPVVQAENNTYYLRHDLRRQGNAAGSAFMDYENRLYPLGFNTVIYAHNMRDGSMFHDLRHYNDPDYFSAHKKISLQTLYEDTLWEIFSFYESDIEFLYNTTTFDSADNFIAFANLIKEKSKYPADVFFT